MTDSIDLSMEDVVAQYRDEVAKLFHEKVLLQAAIKNLGAQQAALVQQVTQLTTDLELAVDERTEFADRIEAMERISNGYSTTVLDRPSPQNRDQWPSQHRHPRNLGPSESGG